MLSVKELNVEVIAEQRQALGLHYVEREKSRKTTTKNARVGT
jgi:hypothetical protein